MATPVVRAMLKNDDWWVNHEYAPTHAARVSGETYSALMVKMATQEQEKMRQQRVEENRVASIKRRARTSAALRAETHNLLAHCPDAWWSLLRGGPRNDAMTPPTAIVVLTPDAASALKRLCRSLLKGHHTNRAAEIDEMLLGGHIRRAENAAGRQAAAAKHSVKLLLCCCDKW